MVTFNELRISEDGKCLIIDAEITNVDIYADMYIKSISIDYYANIGGSSIPSSKAYTVYNNQYDDKKVKAKRITVSKSVLPAALSVDSFENGLFYVIVTCDGTLPATISNFACGYDETVKIGVVLDWKSFYQRGIQYAALVAKKCGSVCDRDNGFEDFIMQWNALRLAINTCNWSLVNDLWSKIVRTWIGRPGIISGGCGCGR